MRATKTFAVCRAPCICETCLNYRNKSASSTQYLHHPPPCSNCQQGACKKTHVPSVLKIACKRAWTTHRRWERKRANKLDCQRENMLDKYRLTRGRLSPDFCLRNAAHVQRGMYKSVNPVRFVNRAHTGRQEGGGKVKVKHRGNSQKNGLIQYEIKC